MYNYDRRKKTAAKMDLYAKWRDIIDAHAEAERRDLDNLLKSTVPYLKSVGLDIDLRRSYLSKYYHGSDGVRIEGMLYLKDRPENTVKLIEFGEREGAERVSKWLDSAIDMYGHAQYDKAKDEWQVDITAS